MAFVYPLSAVDELLALLALHVPNALPLLGSLSGVGEVTELYASFPPDQIGQLAEQRSSGASPFFVVLAHMTGGKDSSDQGRMYCSREWWGEDSPEDARLVYAFVKEYLGQLPPNTHRRIGTVHHRWVDTLRPNTTYVSKGPVAQWVARPLSSGVTQPPTVVPDGYHLGQLTPGDLPRVLETTEMTRTHAYMLSRLPYSVCLRTSDSNTPVACGVLHSDCSVGTIFIEPGNRGRRLGGVIVANLPTHCGRDTMSGWRFTNVVAGNKAGNGLFSSMPGWECGWDTFWMTFIPASEWKD